MKRVPGHISWSSFLYIRAGHLFLLFLSATPAAMPAFKFSSLLPKDKSASSSRRSSMASDLSVDSSITSEPLVSSPIDGLRQPPSSDGPNVNQSPPGTNLRESGVADVDLSHRSNTAARALTLDTTKANNRRFAEQDYSSDDLDTPLASRSESGLFQVPSRSSTHAPSAQAIITQPISVDGLGPVVPATSNTQNLTPAQAVVFAVQSASPSGSSQEVTPNTSYTPAFEGQPMQPSTAPVNGNIQANVDPSIDRSAKMTSALSPPTPEAPAQRRFSSSSKRPASVTILPGGPAPPVHTASLGPPSSAQSVMSLPAPNTSAASVSDHDHSGTHTPAELLSKVKSKVRPHRSSSRASKNALETESLPGGGTPRRRKMGKRERLKARLRASSDAFSTRSSGLNSANDDEHDDSFGDESDTSEESGSDDEGDYDDDGRSVATRSSYYSRMSVPVHGFAVASNKRNLEFHALFPEIDEGDYLIEGE